MGRTLKFAISTLLLLPAGCFTESEPEVEVRLASKTPRVGYVEAEAPDSTELIYLSPEVLLRFSDILDVQPVGDNGDPRIEIITRPEVSEAVEALGRTHPQGRIALLVNGRVETVSPITKEFSDDGLVVLRSSMSMDRLFALAKLLGHG